ncbi:hypothetical protein COCNU_scaffold005638G000010 [Cocos nucifera]|nr:hypothetical protein [Cocos nucifera]
MEDIKIAFAQEAFLEGFEICMRRIEKNFRGVDPNLLTDESSEGVGPSNAGATSRITEPALSAPKLAAEASKSILKPDATKDVSISPASALVEKPSNDCSQGPSSLINAELLSQEIDTQATEMLTKGLYIKKRKGKVPSDGSKRAKGALHKEEFISTKLKATLTLEEERRKEVKNRVIQLETQMAKSISEVMTRAVEVFKTSLEIRNLNVEFGQKAFIKDSSSTKVGWPKGGSDKAFDKKSKEVHLLKKKLKKMEDDLQASRKNTSEVTKEVTRLHGLHMKDAVSFNIWKDSFEKKIIKLKRNASDKSWALTAKISSLEADLKNAGEKIHLVEGSSPWSIDKAQYD